MISLHNILVTNESVFFKKFVGPIAEQALKYLSIKTDPIILKCCCLTALTSIINYVFFTSNNEVNYKKVC